MKMKSNNRQEKNQAKEKGERMKSEQNIGNTEQGTLFQKRQQL